MGTRSTIALEFADGTVQQIYCHWDGYLSHNGAILEQHYMDPFKVKELIGHGDMSSLRSDIGVKHEFDEIVGMCKFYHRDRGEELNIRKYSSYLDYLQNCQEEEYDYILRNIDGKPVWFVRCYATNDLWLSLDRAREYEAASL
jgi:hypothetical protein